MPKKPVNRDEHIKKLSREHHFSLLFCWKIWPGLKTDVAMERIWKYVRYIWQQQLQPHFRLYIGGGNSARLNFKHDENKNYR